jgi:hypothetical protein
MSQKAEDIILAAILIMFALVWAALLSGLAVMIWKDALR